LLLLAACRANGRDHAGDRFWAALHPYCGQAFGGRMTEGTEPSDAAMRAQPLVMHVRSCSPDEIRIPFHVGENRSRTWVITRTPAGVRLKHDHRHEDGTPDAVTQYGGDTRPGDNDLVLEFAADDHTAALIPAASANVWTMDIDQPGTFGYALRRDNSNRRFRVEFDLSNPVPAPPPPW
jgi:hypothetical protein